MKEMKEMKDLQSDFPKESFTKSILSGQTHGKPLCVTDSNSPTVGRDWGRLEGWGRLCFRPQSNPPAMAIKYSLLTA